LRNATVLLPADDEVEDPAAIVDGDVTEHLDPTGLGVDLDHRDVRLERERRAVLVDVELRRQGRPSSLPPASSTT
jgi:hypothetical protein